MVSVEFGTRQPAPGLRRRSILGALGGATVATLAAPTVGQVPNRKRVLVLGAGMAGLTAALSLLRQDHDVRVIERQDRIGGRLLSVPLGDGMFTEAGGGHFRSNMPYVLSYVRRFGLPLLSLNDGLPRYIINGKTGEGSNPAGWPWALAPEERNVTVPTMLNQYLYRAGLDTDTVLDSRWPEDGSLEPPGRRHARRPHPRRRRVGGLLQTPRCPWWNLHERLRCARCDSRTSPTTSATRTSCRPRLQRTVQRRHTWQRVVFGSP